MVGLTFRCTIVATINTSATCSNRRDIHHSPPRLLQHMRHSQLGDDKRAPQIDINCIVPLLDVNVKDVTCALAVACIHDQDVWMLAMLLFDLVEESLQVAFFADVALVG